MRWWRESGRAVLRQPVAEGGSRLGSSVRALSGAGDQWSGSSRAKQPVMMRRGTSGASLGRTGAERSRVAPRASAFSHRQATTTHPTGQRVAATR